MNGANPGKLPITSGLAKWRSEWRPKAFCSYDTLWLLRVRRAPSATSPSRRALYDIYPTAVEHLYYFNDAIKYANIYYIHIIEGC